MPFTGKLFSIYTLFSEDDNEYARLPAWGRGSGGVTLFVLSSQIGGGGICSFEYSDMYVRKVCGIILFTNIVSSKLKSRQHILR